MGGHFFYLSRPSNALHIKAWGLWCEQVRVRMNTLDISVVSAFYHHYRLSLKNCCISWRYSSSSMLPVTDIWAAGLSCISLSLRHRPLLSSWRLTTTSVVYAIWMAPMLIPLLWQIRRTLPLRQTAGLCVCHTVRVMLRQTPTFLLPLAQVTMQVCTSLQRMFGGQAVTANPRSYKKQSIREAIRKALPPFFYLTISVVAAHKNSSHIVQEKKCFCLNCLHCLHILHSILEIRLLYNVSNETFKSLPTRQVSTCNIWGYFLDCERSYSRLWKDYSRLWKDYSRLWNNFSKE